LIFIILERWIHFEWGKLVAEHTVYTHTALARRPTLFTFTCSRSLSHSALEIFHAGDLLNLGMSHLFELYFLVFI